MPTLIRIAPLIALLLAACGDDHRSQPPDQCDELCGARASACGVSAKACKAECIALSTTQVDCLKALKDCNDAAWSLCMGGSGCTPEHPCGGGSCTPSIACDGNQVVKVTCDGIIMTTKTTPCATGQTCLDGQCVTPQTFP